MSAESADRIRTVLWKEWQELRHNRGVMAPALILPLLLTALAISSLTIIARHLNEVSSLLKGQDPRELLVQVGRQMVTLFLVMPCVLPSTTAAHSIIGEKLGRSLEPVLATPVRTWELLSGKMVASVLLGVLPSWFSYAVFLLVLRKRMPAGVFSHLMTPTQMVMVVLIGPLLALFSVAATTMISSRVNDVQAAQSISVLVALPIIGLATSQAAGILALSLPGVLAAVVGLIGLDIGALFLCVSFFERESILTRWK